MSKSRKKKEQVPRKKNAGRRGKSRRSRARMHARAMTKSQIAGYLANKFDLTKRQTTRLLEDLAMLPKKAHLRKLAAVKRGARAGEALKVPHKTTRIHLARPATATAIRRSLGISGGTTRAARSALTRAKVPF